MLWFALCFATTLDRIAAVVDDEVITLTEVYDLGEPFVTQACPGLAEVCVAAAENEVLDSLIRRALIRQELTALSLQVTASDVDSAIDRTVREFKLADRAELRAEVERSGKRWDTYREELFEYLRMQNFQGRVLAPRVSVTDDELRDMYKRKSRTVVRQQVDLDALGIIVPEGTSNDELGEMVAQAQALAASINDGTMSWADAVRDYDGAELASAIGGRAYKEGELVEAIDAAIFAANVVPGKALGPVPVGQVLAILKVERPRAAEGEVVPFEEVKEELRNQVFQEKLTEAEEDWYQRARREASVDIKL